MDFKRYDLISLLAIIAIATPLFSIGVNWGMPNHYSYAHDAISPLRSVEALYTYADRDSGWSDKYPPGHFLLTGLLYKPYLSAYAKTGEDAKEFFGDVRRAIRGAYGDDIASNHREYLQNFVKHRHPMTVMTLMGRWLTIAMSLGSVILLYFIARRLTARRMGGLSAALIAATYYPTTFHAHTLNLDMPYVFWLMVSLCGLLRAVGVGSYLGMITAGVGAAMAVATKDQAYGVVLGYIFLFPLFWKRPGSLGFESSPRGRPFPWRLAFVGIATGSIVFAFAANLVFNLEGFKSHIAHIVGPGSDDYRAVEATAQGQTELLEQVFKLFVSSTPPSGLGAGLIIVGIAIGLVLRAGPTLFAILPAITYYGSFVGVIGYCYARFMIPIVFLAAIPAGRVLADLSSIMKGGRIVGRVVVAGTLSVLVGYSAWTLTVFLDDPRDDATQWLEEHLTDDDYVITYSAHDFAATKLPDRCKFSIIDRFASEKSRQEMLDRGRPTYAVLTLFYGDLPTIGSKLSLFHYKSRVEQIFAPTIKHSILQTIFPNPMVVIYVIQPD